MIDHEHIKRVKSELKVAGMTWYGLMKLATDHLPELIHHNEHIEGVVYGRLEGKLDSVMLVATDKRVLFVDYKPFYKNSDEITYEVVAGVKMTTIGPFAGVVLHTRVQEYALRFVNIRCATIFVNYIENHIESGIKHNPRGDSGDVKKEPASYQPYKLEIEKTKEIETLKNAVFNTDTAVLSTVEGTGVHASVVHYVTDKDENFYFITKTSTTKAKNIAKNNNVALTIHYTGSLKTLLIKGRAVLVNDSSLTDEIYKHITAPKNYTEGKKLPPVTKLENGTLVMFKIVPTTHTMQDFSTSSW
jgi:general stress protein 26